MDQKEPSSAAGWRADFHAGRSTDAWRFLGAHPTVKAGVSGWEFRVWAPAARLVCLMGDFNGWNERSHPLTAAGDGIWAGFFPGLSQYDAYKYAVHGRDGQIRAKADPYAFHAETRPGTASKLYDLKGYAWGDGRWMRRRRPYGYLRRPMNIYEVHLGSWRRTEEGWPLNYRALADRLVPYVAGLGYTHVELLPVTEHPLDDSWGYQCTGYFAATSRFGSPHDLMQLIDRFHQVGIGVILDWVPAHFPKDAFGLYEFDGTVTYEYADPKKREHAHWGTRVFDYGKAEVCSFLLSSALFWLEMFHADGLRVDAVASMLYLDYGRGPGQWTPNRHGGRENLEAVELLRLLNESVRRLQPGAMMIAEESTSWPMVTRPPAAGGLGFDLKWNMGWMNDLLHYAKLDPYFRQHNHKDITFSLMYAFSERFLLPLSHDEVVHMKGSLLGKMPGEETLKFAGVRVFYSYMLTHPGKKLLFMGAELGQINEWHFEGELDWALLEEEQHRQLHAFFRSANSFYLRSRPLWENDFSWQGFEWICADDKNGNCVIFLRRDLKGSFLMTACNFSPIHRKGYRVGLPLPGVYEEVFSSDRAEFGGLGRLNAKPLPAQPVPCHGKPQSMEIDLPPMACVIFRMMR